MAPVSKNKNSTGVFACNEQMKRSIWLSISFNSVMSVSLRPCQVYQLKSTELRNRACLSSKSISVLYFPSGTSSRISRITEKLAAAFTHPAAMFVAPLALLCIKSPKYFVLSTWCIFVPWTFWPLHLL